ncbi:MAG: hypothetical protein KKF46_00950 [Nanoarchaeota archaeon]|nr:hypothetical protein [Nanoarchaeota archaeon]MBU1320902.1 hypothetical protein [Nanoarchaeota archaeon]MBU1597573.1 hypothetical protein [Nanoarchaeota archaeon]MBU2441512.1 hypothetical protein [Nanoarchaeota archaeon]
MSDITIAYSIYGDFDHNRLVASIKSVLTQKKVIPKIIISEENLESKLDGINKELPIRHIYSKPEQNSNGQCVYNTGRIRNRAILEADTSFIYLNDADIVFPNQRYFFQLCEEIDGDEALIWPPSRRLIQVEVDCFLRLVDEKGINEALNHLKNPNEYVANLSGDAHELKVVSHKNGRIYTTEISVFQRYLVDESMKGKEPTFWYDVVHIGGIFAPREMILSVGGYSDSYITWGYEDVDFQWKLNGIYSTRIIPKSKRFEVLHLDHPKSYFSPEQNIRNKQLFEKRQNGGVEKAVKYDLDRLR